MSENAVASCLNDWFIRMSQSVNIEYLALVDENGDVQVSAGNFGPMNREDAEDLLKSYFNQPTHMYHPEPVNDVHIIKQGAVECFITPINGTVQLIAISSIERPSVLIRIMLNELLTARGEILDIVDKEWKSPPDKVVKQKEAEKKMPTKKESSEDENKRLPLEELFAGAKSSHQIKEASKFWDSATLEEQQGQDNEKTISFNEAKRSGLVPDEK